MGSGAATNPSWPNGARFAFSVFDDTDMATLTTGPPVYACLDDLDVQVTKSVWTVAPKGPPRTGGSTCDEPDYLDWVLSLQAGGHEIGYHNASDFPSTRDETIAALDRFRDLFGADPRVGSDHSGNRESMYWGPRRLTGARAWLYDRATAFARPDQVPLADEPEGLGFFSGHEPTSPYFWGDVMRERIDYWRNFTFSQLDLLQVCPSMPYHDAARPYVNRWFIATHAPSLEQFLDALSPARLDDLEASGGACIIYTHFGLDFAPDGRLDPRFVDAMTDLRRRPGWFAPTSAVLDHLKAHHGDAGPLTDRARRQLENRWIADHVRSRAWTELRKAALQRRA